MNVGSPRIKARLVPAQHDRFVALHTAWLQAGQHHAGLGLDQQNRYGIGEQTCHLLNFTNSSPNACAALPATEFCPLTTRPKCANSLSGYNFTPIQSASGMNTQKNGNTRAINREVLITNFAPTSNGGKSPENQLALLGL